MYSLALAWQHLEHLARKHRFDLNCLEEVSGRMSLASVFERVVVFSLAGISRLLFESNTVSRKDIYKYPKTSKEAYQRQFGAS